MMQRRRTEAQGALRRSRRRRARTAAHVWIATALAAMVYVFALLLSYRFDWHLDISSGGRFSLSSRTVNLLQGCRGKITIAAFLKQEHPLYDPTRRLLQAYERLAQRVDGLELDVLFLDVHRDIVAASELATRLHLSAMNSIAVGYDDNWRVVDAEELVVADWEQPLSRHAQRMQFYGEPVLSGAIWEVTRMERPVVYALRGHGEYALEDYGEVSGYSSVARLLRQDKIDVRPLLLADVVKVPDDADALFLLGPKGALAPYEVALLSEYMAHDGRFLVLVDAGVQTGLEDWLAQWGIRLGARAIDPLQGARIAVTDYGEHIITRDLPGMMCMLTAPRVVEQNGVAGMLAGQLHTWALLFSDEKVWAESDVSQIPARFDPESDLSGPLPLGIAAERGSSDADLGLSPVRLVVIGDASFLSNAVLGHGMKGNRDLFMNTVNWLLERPELIGAGGSDGGVFQLGLGVREWRRASWGIVLAWPGALLLLGLIVWGIRRRV